MFKRLAKKIAQKHMELRYPQQPLRLQPDYGERNAADFLGENVVQVNTGISPLRGGPGNAKDEVIADDFFADDFEADFLGDDFEADFEADDIDAEELEGFEIVDDMGLDRMASLRGGRTAKDHEESGSYMSRQNLREMSDMADFIVDDIGMEGLDDWVEDKISQSYSNLNDVARYRGYRDDHPHGEDEESTFKFADDEIIDDLDSMGDEIVDDMGIMADFDKESKVKSHKHHSPKDVKDSYEEQKKNFGKEWEKYEGAMGPDGLDPARIKKNEGGGSKSKPSGMTALDRLAHYDIIDDLEW